MGMFSKKDKTTPRHEANGDAPIDPIRLAAAAVTSIGNPAVGLALVIHELFQRGIVSVDDLAKIGISQDEVAAIVAAYGESGTHEEFDHHLEVQAALRQYNADLAQIAGERGCSTASDEYVALRSAIASFAEENNLLDLKVAYRLMLAECPERIPGDRRN